MKFGLMLEQGYFWGTRANFHKLQLFMTLCDMQSSIGNFSMRHQVPMVFLLLLVYLSVVAYISVEISLGSCWRRDILRVKGQRLITNCNFLWICVNKSPILFLQKCKQQHLGKLKELKKHGNCWRIKLWPLNYCIIYCATSQKVTFCDFCLTFDPKSLRQHGPNFIFSEMQAAVVR